jgi:hypothetical protein
MVLPLVLVVAVQVPRLLMALTVSRRPALPALALAALTLPVVLVVLVVTLVITVIMALPPAAAVVVLVR